MRKRQSDQSIPSDGCSFVGWTWEMKGYMEITIACVAFAFVCVVAGVLVAVRCRRTRRGILIPFLLSVSAVCLLAASPLGRVWIGIRVDNHEVAVLKRDHIGKPADALLKRLGEPTSRLPPEPGSYQYWIYHATSPRWSGIGMDTIVVVVSNKVCSITKTWWSGG